MRPSATLHDHSLSHRIGVLLLALVQLAGASVLPAADGLLDVERYGTPVHVESDGSDDCTPHHDHAFCQVVRSTALANPSRAAEGMVERPIARVAVLRLDPDAAPVRTGLLPGAAGPRAPPAA